MVFECFEIMIEMGENDSSARVSAISQEKNKHNIFLLWTRGNIEDASCLGSMQKPGSIMSTE
jgi:hypothetical protein